jgi:hypothetical protein
MQVRRAHSVVVRVAMAMMTIVVIVVVSLHFAHYNFVRLLKSLRVTPAMAAGVSDRFWTLQELMEQTSR